MFFLPLIVPLLAAAPARGSFGRVDIDETLELLSARKDVLLLDVRRPDEWYGFTGHLEGAVLIPLDQLERRLDELKEHLGKPILVYCRTGRRSDAAAAFLAGHGHTALNVLGGIVEWRSRGLPVVHDAAAPGG